MNKTPHDHTQRTKPKHYRAKMALALLVLVFVFIGLHSQLFVATGIFDFSAREPQRIELDALYVPALESAGLTIEKLEKVEDDINYFVTSMNNAQQGTHFLLGMIAGVVFLQPTAGLTVGLIKEAYDFIQNYRAGMINQGYFIDAVVDTTFWFMGGFVGFYIVITLQDLFFTRGIRGPRDLALFLSKKVLSLRKRPSDDPDPETISEEA